MRKGMKFIGLMFVFFLGFLCYFQIVSAGTCSPDPIYDEEYTLFRLSQSVSSLGALWNETTYTTQVCLDSSYDSGTDIISHDSGPILFWLSSKIGSYASVASSPTYTLPIRSSIFNYCINRTNNCDGSEVMIASLSGLTDANISLGSDGNFHTKICCAYEAPIIPGGSLPSCSSSSCLYAGQKICEGTGFKTCEDLNGDGCFEWSSVNSCSYGCLDGNCVASGGLDCSSSSLPPTLVLNKSLSPSLISDGSNATISFSISGCGNPLISRKNLDVMLVLDSSGSMSGTKLGNATFASRVLLNNLNSSFDKAGLVKFNTAATLLSGLTNNFTLLSNKFWTISASGETNMAAGINLANGQLSNASRVKIIVLLSDGVPNRGGNGPNATIQANNSKNKNITIYSISLGSDANRTLMQRIANITGGKEYYAPQESDLAAIFLSIANDINNGVATDIVLKDVFPVGVQPISVPSGVFYDASSRSINWTLPSLMLGQRVSFSFNVSVNNESLTHLNEFTQINYSDYKGITQNLVLGSQPGIIVEPIPIPVPASMLCSNYTDADSCNHSSSVVGKRSLQQLLGIDASFCGKMVNSTDFLSGLTCHNLTSCGCAWKDNACEPVFDMGYFCDGDTSIKKYGQCSWEVSRVDRCNETENAVLLLGTSVWTPFPTGAIVPADPECKDYSVNFPCVITTDLPFFDSFEFFISILAICFVYFLLRRK